MKLAVKVTVNTNFRFMFDTFYNLQDDKHSNDCFKLMNDHSKVYMSNAKRFDGATHHIGSCSDMT